MRLKPEKKSDTYGTPKWLFDGLNKEFDFRIDVAASDKNHLCRRYYTRKDNAFLQVWDDTFFCNPPFSRDGGGLLKWAEYAFEQSQTYNVCGVMIAVGDISAGHRKFALQHASEIRDLAQRVNFVGGNDRPEHTTTIYVFRPVEHRVIGMANVGTWNYFKFGEK